MKFWGPLLWLLRMGIVPYFAANLYVFLVNITGNSPSDIIKFNYKESLRRIFFQLNTGNL